MATAFERWDQTLAELAKNKARPEDVEKARIALRQKVIEKARQEDPDNSGMALALSRFDNGTRAQSYRSGLVKEPDVLTEDERSGVDHPVLGGIKQAAKELVATQAQGWQRIAGSALRLANDFGENEKGTWLDRAATSMEDAQKSTDEFAGEGYATADGIRGFGKMGLQNAPILISTYLTGGAAAGATSLAGRAAGLAKTAQGAAKVANAARLAGAGGAAAAGFSGEYGDARQQTLDKFKSITPEQMRESEKYAARFKALEKELYLAGATPDDAAKQAYEETVDALSETDANIVGVVNSLIEFAAPGASKFFLGGGKLSSKSIANAKKFVNLDDVKDVSKQFGQEFLQEGFTSAVTDDTRAKAMNEDVNWGQVGKDALVGGTLGAIMGGGAQFSTGQSTRQRALAEVKAQEQQQGLDAQLGQAAQARKAELDAIRQQRPLTPEEQEDADVADAILARNAPQQPPAQGGQPAGTPAPQPAPAPQAGAPIVGATPQPAGAPVGSNIPQPPELPQPAHGLSGVIQRHTQSAAPALDTVFGDAIKGNQVPDFTGLAQQTGLDRNSLVDQFNAKRTDHVRKQGLMDLAEQGDLNALRSAVSGITVDPQQQDQLIEEAVAGNEQRKAEALAASQQQDAQAQQQAQQSAQQQADKDKYDQTYSKMLDEAVAALEGGQTEVKTFLPIKKKYSASGLNATDVNGVIEHAKQVIAEKQQKAARHEQAVTEAMPHLQSGDEASAVLAMEQAGVTDDADVQSVLKEANKRIRQDSKKPAGVQSVPAGQQAAPVDPLSAAVAEVKAAQAAGKKVNLATIAKKHGVTIMDVAKGVAAKPEQAAPKAKSSQPLALPAPQGPATTGAVMVSRNGRVMGRAEADALDAAADAEKKQMRRDMAEEAGNPTGIPTGMKPKVEQPARTEQKAVLPNLILRTDGKPFPDAKQATRVLASKKLEDTHEVVSVEGGKAIAPKKQTAKNQVDPEKDDILTAIAKLGGIDRAQAKSQGVDPADFSRRAGGIQFVFRKNGGKELDRMAEALSELGYPVTENGDYTVNALLDSLDAALRGSAVGTPQFHEAKAQAMYEEEAAQREIDAMFDSTGNSAEPDWLSFGADDFVSSILDGDITPNAVIASELAGIENERTVTGTPEAAGQKVDANPAPSSGAKGIAAAAGGGTERQQKGKSDSQPDSEVQDFGLKAQTEAERLAEEQRQAADLEAKRQADEAVRLKAQADKDVSSFTLTGSNRPADVAAARGQTDIFSAPSEEQVSTKTSEKTGNTTKTYGGYVDGDGVPVELSIVRRADGTLFRVFAKYGDGIRNEFDASYGPGITDEQIVKAVAEPSDWEKVAAKSTADQASEKSKGDRFPSVDERKAAKDIFAPQTRGEKAAKAESSTTTEPVKWFGSRDKADAWIAKNGPDYHVVQAGPSRFEVFAGKESNAFPVGKDGLPARKSIIPKSIPDALLALTGGDQIVFNSGTEFEETVWIEENRARKTWVIKTRSGRAIITEGPVGPDRQWGWGKNDAAAKAVEGKKYPSDLDAPGTRYNTSADRAAADRLQKLLDSFMANRGTPEGAARDAIRSVIEELRKPKTTSSVESMLETASSRLMRQFPAQAEVVDGVIESLGAQAAPAEDLDAMFDDVLEEVTGKPNAVNVPQERTAGQAAVSAAKNTGMALGDAIDGLGKLFGGNKLSSGLTFDEDTYAKAKPYFIAAISHLRAAGGDLREAMRAVVKMVVDKFGVDAAGNMKPYVVQFIADVRDGKIDDNAVGDSAGKSLTDTLYQRLKNGTLPKDNNGLRKLVADFDGGEVDNARLKVAQENLEAAIVMYSRDIAAAGGTDKEVFSKLLDVYSSQPNLNIRTSTSMENQAYSTPAPLAFLASRLAGINGGTVVLEPTAGTGMLLIGADPKNSYANELNPDRADILRAQGFNPTTNDAATEVLVPAGKKVDAVITNPPFGSVKDANGKATKVSVDGYRIGKIDHLIAARALDSLRGNGKATLIIGADKVAGGVSTDDRIFFNWLYSHYNVTGHFEIDGDLYKRQGAGWPVRVITINGRGRSSNVSPMPGTIQRVNNWSEVYDQYSQVLGAQNSGTESGVVTGSESAGQSGNDATAAQNTDGQEGGGVVRKGNGTRGKSGPSNVGGTSAGTVRNQQKGASEKLADSSNVQRPDERTNAQDQLEPGDQRGVAPAGRNPGNARGADAAKSAGGALVDADNAFQTKYIPRSARKDDGVLVPINMAQPTQDSLSVLEDAVGDIDQYAADELGYESIEDLHDALMGLQVDSVASAIYQIKERGKGVIIADQTGIGKGRQAAAIIRWSHLNGYIPVFVTVKPSLFTDMYNDLADIGSNDIEPFIVNLDEWISSHSGDRMFTNKKNTHGKTLQKIANTGIIPEGRNAIFVTYSQINKDNVQRNVLNAVSPNAVFILDESHNAGGESGTGDFIRSVIAPAKGVTYLSATFAKRPDNMPLYFRTDIGDAIGDGGNLMSAMESGGLPLQTVVSNNLVSAGQMFRRERSYDGVNIDTIIDTENREAHEKLSDAVTEALRQIVAADRAFHDGYVRNLKQEMKALGSSVEDSAGNNASESVDHSEFSSVVHNFIRQMLLGMKADTAANEAIAAIKRGDKPLLALENTMGSFLNEYAANNNLSPGQSLGDFDYRTVLSRALDKSRYIIYKDDKGNKEKQYIPLDDLDSKTRDAYDMAQSVIDSLDIDIPVSPLDWMRYRIEDAGYTVAEITGRQLAVDYSKAQPVLTHVPESERMDKVNTTRMFNDGRLDAIILNVAGSTGISLHASEKFKDQRKRHMIVVQPAQDINIFMQMLGRIHRTGQVRLPSYAILNADLPTEKRPTALLNKKMKSLNANTSSNTESATSIKSQDMLNKYGDQVIGNYLAEHPELAMEIDAHVDEDGVGKVDLSRTVTGRMALMPVSEQKDFYTEVEDQYNNLIEYLNETNQNELEPRTFDFEAEVIKEVTLVEATDPTSPFGQEAIYGEYKIKAQGKQMTPDEVKSEYMKHLSGKTGDGFASDMVNELLDKYAAQFNAFRKSHGIGKTFDADKYEAWLKRAVGYGAEGSPSRVFVEREVKRAADAYASGNTPADFTGKDVRTEETKKGISFIEDHEIGSVWRVDINGDVYNAVITNVRNTHKGVGNPFSMSKIQVTLAVNGPIRTITIPASQWGKVEVSKLYIGWGLTIDGLFRDQVEGSGKAKIVTGNLLAAYGELKDTKGTIINFTKKDGSIAQGILLPRKFDFKANTRGDFMFRTAADAFKFLSQSRDANVARFGITSRDAAIRVTPVGDGIKIVVPKSKARGGKYFLDKKLIAMVGDFVSDGNGMVVRVNGAKASEEAIKYLMIKSPLYAIPSLAEEARSVLGLPPAEAKLSVGEGSGPALTATAAREILAADPVLSKAMPFIELKVGEIVPAGAAKFLTAYHGSPYKFDKFSLDHMGKGEGAQVYGWGLYFSGKKAIADWYRETLSTFTDSFIPFQGREYDYSEGSPDAPALVSALADYYGVSRRAATGAVVAIRDNFGVIPAYSHYTHAVENKTQLQKDIHLLLTVLRNGVEVKPKGQLYRVEIPEDDTMLHWDKPLSEQPESVMRILTDKRTAKAFAKYAIRNKGLIDAIGSGELEGWQAYESLVIAMGSPEKASRFLGSIGISGIKVLDGASRSKGEGSHNYVVFDDAAVRILETYYSVGKSGGPEGYYHNGKITLFPENIKATPTQTAEERLKWVAFHEVTHRGVANLSESREYMAELQQAGKNPFIKNLAKKIHAKRQGTPYEVSMEVAIEEALAEAWAALQTGSSKTIKAQYGLHFPLAIRPRAKSAIARFFEAVKRIYNKLTGRGLTNEQVAELLRKTHEAGMGDGPKGGKKFSASSKTINIDGNDRPTTNSNGKPIATTEASIRNFWKWFGDSKVVDEQGRPLVVYHGSRSTDALTEFVVSKSEASNTRLKHTKDGAYFTSNPDKAADYAGQDGSTYPVYLKISKPKMISDAFSSVKVDAAQLKTEGFDGMWNPKGFPSDEIVAIDKNQIKSATGNNGDFSADTSDIRYSAPPTPGQPPSRSVFASVAKQWMFQKWTETLGTQLNTAMLEPLFKPTYQLVQRYLQHTNNDAYDAISVAPNLLGRLEDINDYGREIKNIGKFRKINADREAAAVPLFEGTRFDKKVYSDAVLKRVYNLTDDQVAVYREARAAIEASLDSHAKSVITKILLDAGAVEFSDIDKLVNRDLPADDYMEDLRQRLDADILAANDAIAIQKTALSAAGVTAQDKASIQASIKKGSRRVELLEEAAKRIDSTEDTLSQLKREGYFPLMRWGKYTVTAKDAGGNVVDFRMVETLREKAALSEALTKQYQGQGMTVTSGTMDEGRFKDFRGMSPETLALFAKELGVDHDEAYQEYLKLALPGQSALKRRIHRKGDNGEGIAGFSMDIQRTLASFVMGNARHSARNIYGSAITKSVDSIPGERGDVRGLARNLAEFVTQPDENSTSVSIRNMLFVWNMGASVAFGALNLSQPWMMTLPWLSQFSGAGNVASIMGKASKTAAIAQKNGTVPQAYYAEYQQAVREGHVDPQNVFMLQGIERGGSGLGSSLLKTVSHGMGMIAAATESYNRKLTLFAALDVARAKGLPWLKSKGFDSAYAFAVQAVAETQGVYNKGNRPAWARGPIGAVLLVFKQYAVNWIEMAVRMGRNHYGEDRMRKGLMMMLGLLFAMAGAMGMPGAEDLKDIAETAMGSVGKPVNIERQMQMTLGKGMADAVMAGPMNALVLNSIGLDMHGRVSMGNIIPGTGAFNPYTSTDAKLSEGISVMGAGTGLLRKGSDAVAAAQDGRFLDAAQSAAPRAVESIMKGVRMMAEGKARDARGNVLMETTPWDAAAKILDFQPASVAISQRERGRRFQDKNIQMVARSSLRNRLITAYEEKDSEKIRDAEQALDEWNQDNPLYQIKLKKRDLRRAAKKRGASWLKREETPKGLEWMDEYADQENGQ